tara:strand:- start:1658 stop:2560 length:903 start_codon:yes stop_codon:yes gene_type:complete
MKSPHKNKLTALFNNSKLPSSDKVREIEVLEKYQQWISVLSDKNIPKDEYLKRIIDATNTYKNFIDLDFIFLSDQDFLYRQKGQLKLDNTILEELLPYLIDDRLVPGPFSKENYFVGDEKCYAGLFFGKWLSDNSEDRLFIKQKNQDFAVGKTVKLTIQDGVSIDNIDLKVAYFAAELKTNLDKTMYQEASATAMELKSNVQNSKYYLVCEWLDMTPIDSSTSSIDSVIVLRKAKRISSNVRSQFSSVTGRKSGYEEYKKYIDLNPLDLKMFEYLVEMLNSALPIPNSEGNEIKLQRGHF